MTITTKPTWVLGTGLSHNGSACLLRDGRVAVAIEKERLSGRKGDGGNDLLAIQYCLDAAGIAAGELDLVVQNANFGDFRQGDDWFAGPRALPADVPVVTISHHLAHAACAWHLGPFEEAAVLVVDGCGNAYDECVDLAGALLTQPPAEAPWLWFEKDSLYAAGPDGLATVAKDFSPWARRGAEMSLLSPTTTRHSIGGVYMGASRYCLGDASDLGKLMGLAPYGHPREGEAPIFAFEDGRLLVLDGWADAHRRPCRGEADFRARFSYFADLARRVQGEVERALLALVRHRLALGGHENLCLSGGVALNAVANRRILEETPVKRLFVPPAADDCGLALGCAFHGWTRVLGRARVPHDGGTFFGRAHDDRRVAEAVAEAGEGVVVERPADLVAAVAGLLEAGHIVGWFQGGAEFGPRALGHRSILADPRRAELRDQINAQVKFREDFRPFAPAVLAEEAARYFELEGESPHMLLVVRVREAWRGRIPAVVHVDGTARVQTVSRHADPRFRALLEEFGRRTGLGMLLNTSLNRRGEPMVETPARAVRLFGETGLHALAIGDTLLTKATALR